MNPARRKRTLATPLVLAATVLAMPAGAQEISSAYTDLVADEHCTTFARAAADEGGNWSNLVCSGFRGYPVFISYADARESLFYGFPPGGDDAPVWESFDAFNATAPRIEWRLESRDGQSVPFAVIHRWFVSDPQDPDEQVQVLVVAKVGQPVERNGCAVGYVVASGNPNANDRARSIADTVARSFVCGADEPTIEQGSVALPSFTRSEN